VIDVAGDEETRTIDLDAPGVKAEIHPLLADEAKTCQFLNGRGEALTPAAKALFLSAVRRQAAKGIAAHDAKAGASYGDKIVSTPST
jgi:hypothetical protein